MPDDKPGPITVQVEPDLLAQIFADAETIAESAAALATAVHALTAATSGTVVTKAAVDAAAKPAAPASQPVWDLRPQALENYDAESLVNLRKEHLSVDHDTSTCQVCAIVDRRLGYRDPPKN